jgi:hypothetical protein
VKKPTEGIPFNLNDYMTIVLNQEGVDIYNAFYAEMGIKPSKEMKAGDSFKSAAWDVMRIWGKHMRMGHTTPMDMNVLIHVPRPLEEQTKQEVRQTMSELEAELRAQAGLVDDKA